MLLVRGVGIGFSFVPAMTAAFASLRPEQLSDATPQLNVLQRLGGAIGTAVLAVVLQRAAVGAHTLRASSPTPSARLLVVASGSRLLSLIPCLVLLKAERPSAPRPWPQDEQTESLLRHESAIEAGI